MSASPGREIAFSPATNLLGMLSRGELSAVELTQSCLDRISELDGTARAFIAVTGEAALEAAAKADRARAAGGAAPPLCGLPFASKDLIDIAGVRTTVGSKVLHDNMAGTNAHLIECMFAAGAVSLGKTNLHEFAYGATGENPVYGTAVNAYDTSRIAGGSSSGSAAAVAFGLAACAFGTDTGGSVRAPAALSGLVGLKPTLGRISTRGVIPYAWTLDHIGIIARTVADAALLLQITAGHDPRDPASAGEPVEDYMAGLDDGISGLRVGLPRKFFFERCDPEIEAATQRVLRFLERRGARLVEIDMPSMEQARTVSLTIQMPEALSFHSRYLEERGDRYGQDFRAGLALGQCILAEHYVRARRMISLYRNETNAAFEAVDVIATPATPVLAPPLGVVRIETAGTSEAAGNAITRYTTFFNMSGHPAITVPSGLSRSGLPMGVQFVARYFEEARLLRAAHVVNSAGEFFLPTPDLTGVS